MNSNINRHDEHGDPCVCGCGELRHARTTYSRFICLDCTCTDYEHAAATSRLMAARLGLES